MGQPFQFGKHQHISINLSFAGQGIYLPVCCVPFTQKEDYACSAAERKSNIWEKQSKGNWNPFKMSFRQISSTINFNEEIFWGSEALFKKCVD